MKKTMLCLSALLTILDSGCPSTQQPESIVVGERGNWVKKRLWVKEAQVVQEQIVRDAGVAKKTRTQFSDELTKVDAKVNAFYGSKGFERGKLGSLIEDIKNDIAADKQRRIVHAKKRSESDDAPINFYDVHLEAIEQEVKRFERDFEQFNLDMKSIADLDSSLIERMKMVDKHIKEVGDLSIQSGKKLDEMWWIIDDTKAADVFYAIQEYADKVSAIKKYLSDTLLADFKKVVQTLEKQMEQVEKQIKNIEERGFLVGHRSLRLKQQEVSSALSVVEDEVNADQELKNPVRRKKRAVKQDSMWEYCMSLPGTVWAGLNEVDLQACSALASFFGVKSNKAIRRPSRVESE